MSITNGESGRQATGETLDAAPVSQRGGFAAVVKSPLTGRLLAILGLAIALALLEASGLSFWQGLVVNLGIFMILVLSLNLASGFTGVFSLGHIGFMALGAYASAILTLPLMQKADYLPNLPAWLAWVHFDFYVGSFPLGFLLATIIAAGLVSLVALPVGLVLMRLSGHFVAVATLGFLVIVRVILFNADNFTRGSRTFSNVTPYTNLWWVWAWALLTLYVVWRLKYSPFGRAMFAQKADPLAAQAIGIAAGALEYATFLYGGSRFFIRPFYYLVFPHSFLFRPDLSGNYHADCRRVRFGEWLGVGHHFGYRSGRSLTPA